MTRDYHLFGGFTQKLDCCSTTYVVLQNSYRSCSPFLPRISAFFFFSWIDIRSFSFFSWRCTTCSAVFRFFLDFELFKLSGTVCLGVCPLRYFLGRLPQIVSSTCAKQGRPFQCICFVLKLFGNGGRRGRLSSMRPCLLIRFPIIISLAVKIS